MNEMMIFKRENFDELDKLQNECPSCYAGVVYCMEYKNGEFSKIGCSKVPKDRAKTLKHYLTDYMQEEVTRIAISPWHTNYKKNERIIHEMLSEKRIPNTELFNTSIDDFGIILTSGEIKFLDESERLEKEAQYFCDEMKKFLLGSSNDNALREKIDRDFSEDPLQAGCDLVSKFQSSLSEYCDLRITELKAAIVDYWIKIGFIEEKDVFDKCENKDRELFRYEESKIQSTR